MNKKKDVYKVWVRDFLFGCVENHRYVDIAMYSAFKLQWNLILTIMLIGRFAIYVNANNEETTLLFQGQ